MDDKIKLLVGNAVRAGVVEIFAVVSNSDTNGGRGDIVDVSYHSRSKEAEIASLGVGVMGSKAKVETRLAVKFQNGTVLLLAHGSGVKPVSSAPLVELTKPTSAQINLAFHSHYHEANLLPELTSPLKELTPEQKLMLLLA